MPRPSSRKYVLSVHLIPSVNRLFFLCFSFESREDDGSLCQPLQIVISRSGVTWFPSIEEENRDAVWPGPQNVMLADERRFACGDSLVRVFPKFHVELLGNVIIVGRSVFSRSRVARHEVFGSPNQIRLSRNILSVVTWMRAWMMTLNIARYAINVFLNLHLSGHNFDSLPLPSPKCS